jgi:hypothetical protein
MKIREIMLEGCMGEIFVPKRSVEEEGLLNRHGIGNEVSREDTRGSGSRI